MLAEREAETLELLAPLEGWGTPLDELPDPVFAGRMLGDGVAIDPTSGVVRAPCDGEVVALPASRHAVTLRASNGAEILIHVGIDTVGLQGSGFEALVEVGARVRKGTPLLRFDLDGVAQRAKSLLTPVIIVNEGFVVSDVATGRAVSGDARLMRVTARRAAETAAHAGDAQAMLTRTVRVALAHGLHARPAARIAQAARRAAATVHVGIADRTADARSVTSLMALGVRLGDDVRLQAHNTDELTLDAIAEVLQDASEPEVSTHDAHWDHPTRTPSHADDGIIRAVIASRGLAVGTARHLRPASFDVPEHGAGPEHEAAALERALERMRSTLQGRAQSAQGAMRDVTDAHLVLLDDPALRDAARQSIAAGRSAGRAWRDATRAQAALLERLDDPYLRERVADLKDLEGQVLTALGLATKHENAEVWPERTIVLAHDLLPSQFTGLDFTRVVGLCTAAGGPTAHVAILASAVGLPMLVAAGPALETVPDGLAVLLDAHAGLLHVAPDTATLATAERRVANERRQRDHERAAAQRPACTADGQRIAVYANLGTPAEALQAVALGAEGCGLLRSEFLFLDRHTAPSEDEQLAIYQQVANGLDGRPLTIRTLDVGGDKPLDYLPMPHEDNPALGLRGVRTSLFRRDLLREQLRAILRVRPLAQCRIMLPMVTDVSEVFAVREELAEVAASLGIEDAPALGVMIETPAAALLADSLAPAVQFFSIGTNDLTQYTLAMDRTHPHLAARLDGLHPAVLRLVASVGESARRHARDVAVCGGLAMDSAAIPILLGLGVHELSVPPAAIPAVKARIASLELEACRSIAHRALQVATAEEARALGQPT
jgi:phosphoenolpyruvate-protein phosphotransferase